MEEDLKKYVETYLTSELAEILNSNRHKNTSELNEFEKHLNNSLMIKFLEDILANDLATTKKSKLSVIDLLDDLNYRNEILHLMASKNSLKVDESLKKTSERMGRKFMSSEKE